MSVILKQIGNRIVVRGDELVYELIRKAVAARPDGYKHMPKYKAKVWDGFISLFDKRTKTFPIGLLDKVRKSLEAHSIEFDLDLDDNLPAVPALKEVKGYELHQYQREAVATSLRNYRGVLSIATNGGKTLIMASIVKSTGCRAVIVVPTRSLMHQTAQALEQMLDIEIGMFGDGEAKIREVNVVVINSLPKLLRVYGEELSINRTLIIDECHHTKADTVFDNTLLIPAYWRIGCSGTPLTDKLGDLRLTAVTGRMLYDVPNVELIEMGVSVPPEIIMVVVEKPEIKSKDFGKVYKLGIVHNKTRNRIIKTAYEVLKRRGNTLILVNYIAHATNIKEMIPEATVVTGSTPHIADVLKDAYEGNIPLLVATRVFGEGVNIPLIHNLILAAGGDSRNELLQRIGRGLRAHDTKNELIVIDFIDDTNAYLLEHSKRRADIYVEEGFNVELLEDPAYLAELIYGTEWEEPK